MEFGFHVTLDSGCIPFLKRARDKGIKSVKIHIPFDVKRKAINEVCSFLYKNEMKAYFVLVTLTQTPCFKDPMYTYLTEKKDDLFDRYQKVLGYLKPKSAVLGVGLIENIELAVKTGNKAQFGLSRNEIIDLQQQISTMISQFKVVMKSRPDDVEANYWKDIDCDVYDFSGMVDRNLNGKIDSLPSFDKEVWISDATMYGGFTLPIQQGKFLKDLKTKARKYPYVFLYRNNSIDWDLEIL